MTPVEFVKKWAAAKGTERQVSQQHFLDICELLHEQKPAEADPGGEIYSFEKGAKTLDGDGFADVWLKGHFAWEYKGKRKDLTAAYKQVQTYREALGNPPLLIVCDLDRYEIHTNWTNTEKWIYRFLNADLTSDEPVEVSTSAGPAVDAPELTARQVLKAVFESPDRLKPQRTTEQITARAASLFGEISAWLRKWQVDEMRIARFVTRMIFCMFATDVGLLPRETFSHVIDVQKKKGDSKAFRKHLAELFAVMNTGGEFALHEIPHFDGNLFTDNDVPEHLTTQEILTLAKLDELNWTEVEPSIFGTLFERILDPSQRQKLGAHYTSRADIELIVEPVLMAPLRESWRQTSQAIDALLDPHPRKPSEARRKKADALVRDFHKRLASIRILDPACGSGNFLYVSMALLKALEKEVIAFAESYGIKLRPRVHPKQLLGLEINPYAVEIASIVIWIGYLQWKHHNVMPLDDEDPILQPLNQVRLLDAVVERPAVGAPVEPAWPEADIIVGNPPFLGGKRLRTVLGDSYVEELFHVWDGRVPREADLCCYWFEKAREQIEAGKAKRAGLLATQAIRGGKNRRVLERIKETGDIFYAQTDRKWIQDGVAVRVSMVGFDDGSETRRILNESVDDDPVHALLRAKLVETINADLTSASDVTQARRLKENIGISFMGDTKVGPFDIPEHLAQQMLQASNPHKKPNGDVVRPWVNGLDITRRPRNMWIVDFPPGMSEKESALYEAPFEHVKKEVQPERAENKRQVYAANWWIHGEPRPAMRTAFAALSRYVATPNLTKYRFFVWLATTVLPDHQLIVFARDDDYFFGALHSRVHELWARQTGTQLREAESGFRYTPTSCFETFPFPKPHAKQKAAIAAAAKELNELRENWLNPSGLVGDKALAKLTLTNLYNERPTWLANAHRALDEALLSAYGWADDPDDAEILARLLKLNLEREPA